MNPFRGRPRPEGAAPRNRPPYLTGGVSTSSPLYREESSPATSGRESLLPGKGAIKWIRRLSIRQPISRRRLQKAADVPDEGFIAESALSDSIKGLRAELPAERVAPSYRYCPVRAAG
jgi:hypothetical protein